MCKLTPRNKCRNVVKAMDRVLRVFTLIKKANESNGIEEEKGCTRHQTDAPNVLQPKGKTPSLLSMRPSNNELVLVRFIHVRTRVSTDSEVRHAFCDQAVVADPRTPSLKLLQLFHKQCSF